MSAFIVISLKDSMNWIVDGIVESRPHNPDVITHLSTGKFKPTKQDMYLYECTIYSKHAGVGNANEVVYKNTTESHIPSDLFKNQISQFLNVCENEGEQINIFLLDNPITDDDFEQSTSLTKEIRSVYDSHFVTNFQLVRVLFSYHVDKPTDVTRQVSQMVLEQLLTLNTNNTDDFLTRILYVDNQNRNGAAICLNKEGHDIMLPRMLCDLMMLLSNKEDAYNTSAAINSDTRTFAIGYSECMYYQNDIFRYYSLASERDLIENVLRDKNDCNDLDYDKNPWGLEERLNRLSKIYEPIPFDADINSAYDSIDKRIDDILLSLKDYIIDIKKDALLRAEAEDREATELARNEKTKELEAAKGERKDFKDEVATIEQDFQQNSSELSNRKGCNFLAGIFHRKKAFEGYAEDVDKMEVDPRVADINITKETDRVKEEFPDFISRELIYEQFKLEQAEGDLYEGVPFETNKALYRRLLEFIQSNKFVRYLKNITTVATKVAVECDNIKKTRHKKVQEYAPIQVDTPVSWIGLKVIIDSINTLKEEQLKYEKLKTKVNELKRTLELKTKEVHDFRLTTHCSSVDNLIDLDKLKEFHAKNKDIRIKEVKDLWEKRDDDTRHLESLMDDLKEITKWEVYSFYYISWNKPLPFIKEIDLTGVCQHLKAKSQPFVNTYTLCPNAENLTSYTFYTDNETWHNNIKTGKVDLKDSKSVSSMLSSHICSKICMFQFLQMSKELIHGLVDCYKE